MLTLKSKSVMVSAPWLLADEDEECATLVSPLPISLAMPPMMLGRNIANMTLLTICAPMNSGSSSFFSPKARNPRPNPVRKEFLPNANLAATDRDYHKSACLLTTSVELRCENLYL